MVECAAQLCRSLCHLCLMDQNRVDEWRRLGFDIIYRCIESKDQVQREKELASLKDALENKEDSLLRDLLICTEHCQNAELVALLARILEGYINSSVQDSKQRLQFIAKLNGVSYLTRSMRSVVQMYDGRPVMMDTLRVLIRLNQLVGSVDGRFYMKVRFSGLLAICANAIASGKIISSLELIRFLIVVCHSGKNAAMLSKNEKFVSFIKLTFSDHAKEDREVTLQCSELLYLMAKPKRTREVLVAHNIVLSVLNLFQAFFDKTDESSWTICMAALGTLRLLTATMAGRQRLVECNGLSLFRECVKSFSAEEGLNRQCSILYHAMSSLCIRCLPMTALPVDTVNHPVEVALPIERVKYTPADILSDSEDELSIAAGFLTDTDDEGFSQKISREGPAPPMKLFKSELHWYRYLCRELEFGTVMADEISETSTTSDRGLQNLFGDIVEVNETMRKRTPQRRRNSLSGISDLRLSSRKPENEGAKKAFYSSLFRRMSCDSGPRPDPTWYTWMEYVFQAATTESVCSFVTIAFPDFHGLYLNLTRQRLKYNPNVLMDKLEPLIQRIEGNGFEPKVVYDLDVLLNEPKQEIRTPLLLCDDIMRLGKADLSRAGCLKFESRFESGNLRKVIQVGLHEYDLILMPDTNQINEYYHTFYFQVSNMVSDVPYTFNIINCVKTRSLYNSGMQPVVFSVTEALLGRPGWVRSGRNCVYYRNCYSREHAKSGRTKAPQTITSYYTASFTLQFRHAYDICYFAYHYPYTYSMLKTHIVKLQRLLRSVPDVHYRKDMICRSIGGNPVILVTVTNAGSRESLKERDVVVLSSRVHPGESNSSWMMHGLLNYLVSPHPRAVMARSMFIFKLIPMLNVDGVVNGNHRCSLAGEDMNRQWVQPNKQLYPSVYHTKNLIGYLNEIGKTPLVYCDFHGHSRKKNIFAYGNNPNLSWYSGDRNVHHKFDFYKFPEILDQVAPGFRLKYCAFDIKKNKEGSARVAVWRDTGAFRVYTLEASYAGFDHGPYEGYQVSTKDLIEMGEKFVDALITLKDELVHEIPASRRFEFGTSNGCK